MITGDEWSVSLLIQLTSTRHHSSLHPRRSMLSQVNRTLLIINAPFFPAKDEGTEIKVIEFFMASECEHKADAMNEVKLITEKSVIY